MKKLFALALFSAFAACGDLQINDNNIDTSQHVNVLTAVTNGSVPTNYQYDGGKLVGITQQGGNGNQTTYSPYTAALSYDAGGRLSQIYYNFPAPGGTFTHAVMRYDYGSGARLQGSKYFTIDPVTSAEVLVSTTDFTYGNDTVSALRTVAETGARTKTVYTSVNGNVTQVDVYNVDDAHPDGVLDHTVNYSDFDEMRIADESLPESMRFPMIFTHNYRTITQGTSTNTFEYTYNADGYPVKRTQSGVLNTTYDFVRL